MTGDNSFTIQNYKFWLDGYLKSNLDIFINEAIPNKWDGLFIMFGGEGSGKSTLTSQLSLYLDHKFNMNYCVFTPQQFESVIDNCKDESSIQWDEAITGANASLHASNIQVSIISKLTQIRKKRLKIFLCFPYLSMLRRYFLERCLFGVYIYAKDFNDRGYANFYSQPELLELHYLMKEKYKYNPTKAIAKVKKSFYFKFCKTLCLNESEYDKKKESSRVEFEKNDKGNIWKFRFIDLIRKLRDNNKSSVQECAKYIGITKRALYEHIKEK